MASSQLVLALDAIARLDRELTAVLGYADVLAVSHDAVAIAGLRQRVESSQATIGDLRRRIAASAIGADLDARTCSLRVRAAVVLSQLVALRDAEPDEAGRSLLGPRFATALDLQGYLVDRLGGVMASWRSARRRIDASGEGPGARQTLEVLALGNAEWGFATLGMDVDLGRALATGSHAGSARVRIACRTMLLALGAYPGDGDGVEKPASDRMPHESTRGPF